MAVVYGKDKSLLALPAEVADRPGVEAVREFRRRLHVVRPARRRGIASYSGKVKNLSLRDLLNDPVVKAVRTEMHRQRIGDLCGTRLEDELVELACASLLDRSGPYEADTVEEAVRIVVAATIEAGEHEAERAEIRLASIIEAAERCAPW